MAGPAAELGLDRSGNGNNFAVAGTLGSDQMVDTPTNNFCTMNPLSQNVNATLDEGNLQQTGANESHGGKEGTFTLPKTGKWYWEVYIKSTDSSRGQGVGIGKAVYRDVNNWGNYSEGMFYMGSEEKYDNGYSSYGANHAAGNIIGVAWNSDDTELTFYHNNSTQGTLDSFNSWISADALVPILLGRNVVWVANFGQDSSFAGNTTAQGNQDGNGIGDFYYTPPTGYLALCTKNLPDVGVVPSEHFTTLLNAGDSSGDEAFVTGFQPDWVWSFVRNVNASHESVDSVRGATKVLMLDQNDEELTDAESLISFNSNGFTTGTNAGGWNRDSRNYAYYSWKGGEGSTSSNTDGDINSTVSVNSSGGFSIVSYTGNGSSNQTVGHGLGQDIDMVIVKNRAANNTDNWRAWHSGLTGNSYFLGLNQNATQSDSSTVFNGHSSSTFTIGNDSAVNNNGDAFIAYCFRSVVGYSKFGTYEGNNSTDGSAVNLGFRPALVIIKDIDTADHWHLWDNKRDTYNPSDTYFKISATVDEESGSSWYIDFLSNGFKLRNDDTNSNDAESYIYMAFAEVPFKYANAR